MIRPPEENVSEFDGQYKQRKRRRKALMRATESPEDHPTAEVVTPEPDDHRTREDPVGQPNMPPGIGLEQSKACSEKSGRTPDGRKGKRANVCQPEKIQDWDRPPERRPPTGGNRGQGKGKCKR